MPSFLVLLFFGPDIVLQVGERLVALENKIDETLTESISILKQVTLFYLSFTIMLIIKKRVLFRTYSETGAG